MLDFVQTQALITMLIILRLIFFSYLLKVNILSHWQNATKLYVKFVYHKRSSGQIKISYKKNNFARLSEVVYEKVYFILFSSAVHCQCKCDTTKNHCPFCWLWNCHCRQQITIYAIDCCLLKREIAQVPSPFFSSVLRIYGRRIHRQ